jgi:hypothetical protein
VVFNGLTPQACFRYLDRTRRKNRGRFWVEWSGAVARRQKRGRTFR